MQDVMDERGVWRLSWDHDFRPLTADEPTLGRIRDLGLASGRPMAQEWEPLTVHRSHDEEFADLPDGDFPLLLPGLAIFRTEVAQALVEEIPHSQLLTLRSSDHESLALLHTMCFVDCLDLERSKAIRFSSGRLRRIEFAVFERRNLVGADPIWRIPEDPYLLLVHGESPILNSLLQVAGLSLHRFGELAD